MTKITYLLTLVLSVIFIDFTYMFRVGRPTNNYETAIIQTLQHTTKPVFTMKTDHGNSLKITKLSNLETSQEFTEVHEQIEFNRNRAKSIHKSWINDLIDSSEATAANQEQDPIYNYAQVSFGIIYTKSNPKGYLVTMDTGSSHAVLPLKYDVTDLSETYTGIQFSNIFHYANSIYYGLLVKCPGIFKPEYMCTSASYVGSASNSVVGVERLYTSTNTKYFKEVVAEYKLNLLRGPGADLIGIFGIGFGLRGFNTTPFLTPFYSKSGPQTLLFTETYNDTPESKSHDNHRVTGSIKINTEFDEDEYKWALFDKRGLNYSLNVMYGVYIDTKGAPGVYDMDDSKFSSISKEMEHISLPTFEYSNFMFDSGTNGFILNVNNLSRVYAGLNKIYGKMLIVNQDNDTLYICWPDKETAKLHHVLSPDKVYMNILLENIRAAVSLEGISLFGMKTKMGTFDCTYIMVVQPRDVQVLGYPAWKKLDLLWDSNGSRVGIKNGITNK